MISKHIKSFNTFTGLLLENLNQARKILNKYKKTEEDENFVKIREIIETEFGKNNLGFIGLFTKFFYVNKTSLDILSALANKISNNRHLLKYLPKQIVSYDDPEKLEDDLNKLEEFKKYNQEFVSNLKGQIKSKARYDIELMSIYNGLSDEMKNDIINNFVKPKSSRYKDFKSFKEDVILYTQRSGNPEEIIEYIEKTKGAYLFYNEKNFIVAEIYDRSASCQLGSKSWCISGKTGSYWQNYAGLNTGNKQYFIWNLNVPISSLESLIGVTIKPNGDVKTAHLKNDKYLKFSDFCKKYNLDESIFRPMDISKDYHKIIETLGLNKDVIRIISKDKNGTEILKKYKSQIPKSLSLLFGLLDENEIKDLIGENNIKSLIYNKEIKSDIPKRIIDFCNEIEDSEDGLDEYINKNKDNQSFKWISEMNFIDKIYFINNRAYSKFYGNLPLKVFFNKEIKESEFDLKIKIDYYNDISFEFDMDLIDYCDYILNSTEDFYYGMNQLEYGDSYLSDWYESEEYNYILGYLDDKTEKVLKEYLEYLSGFITNEEIKKDLKNFSDFGDIFSKFCDIVSQIDPKFNIDSGYIYDYLELISDSASELVSADSNEWKTKKVGDYNDNQSIYSITLDEIYENFDITIYDDDFSINDWIKSHPSDSRNMNFHFYDDIPYASAYLSQAERSDANKKLREDLQEVLDNGLDDTEKLLSIKKFEEILIKQKWNSEKYSNSYGSNMNYFYTYNSDVKGEFIDGVQYFKEYIIPTFSIDENGYCNLFILNKPIGKYQPIGWGKNSNYNELIKMNDHQLKERNISKKEIYITDFNPNQLELELKFEKLKSFKDFKKLK